MNFFENGKNKTITIVCSSIAIICMYLIQDESLFRMMTTSSINVIGSFEKPQKDVRKKNTGNYFWENLTTRDKLSDGDSVFTGSDSSVIVKLQGGQKITVAPNSLIKFRTKNKKLVIDIPYGGVQLNNVVKDLVISDCGQNYDLSRSIESINLKKSERCGSVAVETKSPEINKNFAATKVKTDVKQTFLAVASAGALKKDEPRAAEPKPLPPVVAAEPTPTPTPEPVAVETKPEGPLEPPIFQKLEIKQKVTDGGVVVLEWEPVATASSYEIQVSETPQFTKVEKYKTDQSQFKLKKVESNLFFRGKALGENGRVSTFSKTGKIHLQFPGIKLDKPVLIKDYQAKNPNDKGPAEKFDISWSTIPLADNYTIEVRDGKNSEPIKTLTSRAPASSIEVPQPGKFSYQVYALDAQGRKISSSDEGEVRYNKVFGIKAPVIKQDSANRFYFFQQDSAKYVWLSWVPIGPENKFRVEIAKDKDFSKIIKSVFTTQQKLLVTDQVEDGEYFWHVRSEEGAQFSDWSNTETFKIKINSVKSN